MDGGRGAMKKVFLSYSSKDQKTAASICQALETRGHPCWMSTRDVRPGENFQGRIRRGQPQSRREVENILLKRQQLRRDKEGNGAGQPVQADGHSGPRRGCA